MAGGPYLRYNACRFKSRALSLNNLALSFNSPEIWLIPEKHFFFFLSAAYEKLIACLNRTLTVKTVSTPQKIFHIFGHNSSHVLQVFIELGQIMLRPGILIYSLCLLHKRIYKLPLFRRTD
jgi:hypothetical protein